MKLTLALAVVLGVVVEFCISQGPPPMPTRTRNLVRLPSGSFGKGPPKPGARPTLQSSKDRIAALRERLSGNNGNFRLYECNLKRVQPFQDPVIKRMATPSLSNSRQSPIVSMAITRAARGNSPAAAAVRALQASAKQIQASQARAAAQVRQAAANRTKRQADGLQYMAETVETTMCPSMERNIMTVVNEGDTCYTFAPQKVSLWECASTFVRGLSNPFPSMQNYYCEPTLYSTTSWYVVCPNSRADRMIRIQSAYVPINCNCMRYKCNFEPYQSNVPLTF